MIKKPLFMLLMVVFIASLVIFATTGEATRPLTELAAMSATMEATTSPRLMDDLDLKMPDQYAVILSGMCDGHPILAQSYAQSYPSDEICYTQTTATEKSNSGITAIRGDRQDNIGYTQQNLIAS